MFQTWLGLEKRGCPHGECNCWLAAEQKHGCCKCDQQPEEKCECGKCRTEIAKEHETFCCSRCDCSCGIRPKSVGLSSLTNARGDYECTPCDPSRKRNCFPATASVKLESGKQIKMSELQVGDRVQTGMWKPAFVTLSI